MIAMSATAAALLTGSYTYHVRAESWLGSTLLAEDIPIATGGEQRDRSLRVPERVTLTVPRIDGGTDWTPSTDLSPLAANGQRLRIELGIQIGADRIEWLQRGWFVIYSSGIDADGRSISVEARGLLHLIDEARLVSPYQPTGTILSTLRGLVEPGLTVINRGATDRAVPPDVNFDEDRLGAVGELLDAWPADGQVSPEGILEIRPSADDGTVPVLALAEDTGTVVETTGSSTREGAWTVVVARGTASDGGQVQGVAYLSTGPKAYTSKFNPLPVPYFFNSPLLTTPTQAGAAAQTVMIRLARKAARMLSVECVPHPGLLLGDVISLTSSVYTGNAVIEQLDLPYVAQAGAMRLLVRCLS
jgi:hypothetical protein